MNGSRACEAAMIARLEFKEDNVRRRVQNDTGLSPAHCLTCSFCMKHRRDFRRRPGNVRGINFDPVFSTVNLQWQPGGT
jgi:hypothetical protein